MTKRPAQYSKIQLEARDRRIKKALKERTKEVWHWNRDVKGDDHPDTQRALREMQEAHGIKPTQEKDYPDE